MPNDHQRPTKSVDLPPRGNRNRDPITKAPGAHPIEVGAGTALGGAAAGLAAGAVAGPIGAVIGAVAGGVAGGYGGKAVGEAIDPTTAAETRPAGTKRAERAKRPAAARTGGTKTLASGGARKAEGRAAGTRSAAGRARGRGKPAATTRAGNDDRRKRGPQDRARVNVNERWEVDYWCERFGVTPARLRQAVQKAGPMVKDVRRQLKK